MSRIQLIKRFPKFSIPSTHSEEIELELYLRVCGIEYESLLSIYPYFPNAGELPALRFDNQVYGGVEPALNFAVQECCDLDEVLTPVERSDISAYTSLVRQHLPIAEEFVAWYLNDNFKAVTSTSYCHNDVNFLVHSYLNFSKRRSALNELQNRQFTSIQKVVESVTTVYTALAAKLGSNRFFSATPLPCSLDVLVASHICVEYFIPYPTNPFKSLLETRFPHLIRHAVDLLAEYMADSFSPPPPVLVSPSSGSSSESESSSAASSGGGIINYSYVPYVNPASFVQTEVARIENRGPSASITSSPALPATSTTSTSVTSPSASAASASAAAAARRRTQSNAVDGAASATAFTTSNVSAPSTPSSSSSSSTTTSTPDLTLGSPKLRPASVSSEAAAAAPAPSTPIAKPLRKAQVKKPLPKRKPLYPEHPTNSDPATAQELRRRKMTRRILSACFITFAGFVIYSSTKKNKSSA